MTEMADFDPAETRDWLDSLDAVLAFDGPDRATFLLDELIAGARRDGVPMPYSANTPYLMLDRGYGRIVNISSVVGSAGGFGQANYAAAKSGMFGLTMSLALETASKGITVNTVTPGYITTEMTAAVPGTVMEKIVGRIPEGRLGDPNEVARVVEFLADPESGYITGQVYPVNGGLYM